jgi:transcriptional regulator of nitric oxide reductase
MEAHMVRRMDRPVLRVHVSFEATRTGPQHLLEAYARLVPTIRRTSQRPARRTGLSSKVTGVTARSEGEQ